MSYTMTYSWHLIELNVLNLEPMSRFELLRKLILKHRGQLVLTYTLFSLEMTGHFAAPIFFGRSGK